MGQFIEGPNRNDALLNLLISHNVELITDVKRKLGNSDHNIISFNLSYKNTKRQKHLILRETIFFNGNRPLSNI